MMPKKNILVVDDERKLRTLYADMLAAERYGVICTDSVEEALKSLVNEHIDLVLLDIRMPDRDGIAVSQHIEQMDVRPRMIVFSDLPIEEQARIIRGADAYHDKSHDIRILREKVRMVLEVGG